MRDIWFQQVLVTHPKHVFVYDFHTLFFNLACFWYPKRCTRVHRLVLKNDPNYVNFFTRMISTLKYKWPPWVPPPFYSGMIWYGMVLFYSGMIWGVRIAIFTEIRHLVEELITFLSFFGPQKLRILTARLNKSLWYQLLIQSQGISVLKHAKTVTAIVRTTAFENSLIGHGPCMHAQQG